MKDESALTSKIEIIYAVRVHVRPGIQYYRVHPWLSLTE